MMSAYKIRNYGYIRNNEILLTIPLILAALYINLGLIPLKGDEAIRATVALEMMLSGNYITPTLAGELYLNKPPLYNWILIGFFTLFHNDNEFIVRFPTTLFLILYCLIIFYWVKKELGRQMGIFSSLAFLTCARILFWDSFLGLIDIAYSAITFLNFMLIWHFYRKGKYHLLFLASYSLTAIAFLLKGFPSLVFQGITLLVIFIQHRGIKGLISWKHLMGILVFFMLLLPYYLAYYFQNPGHLDNALLRLITESTDKSAIGGGFQKTLIHVATFPFELIRHFLPWSLLVLFLFHRKIFSRLMGNDFTRYCFLVACANIVVYWLSPTTYPRYLLMLMPLAFVVFIYAGRFHELCKTIHYRLILFVLLFFAAGLFISSIALPVFYSGSIPVNQIEWKAGLILLAGAGLYLYLKPSRPGLFFSVILVLLLTRISFNVFLQPYREHKDILNTCRSESVEMARGTKGQRLFYMTDTITIHNVYYITRERDEILTYRERPDGTSFFIVDDTVKAGFNFKPYYTMHVPYYYQTYYAGKFEHQ